jgi:transcriptional regulator with XRE-family HTH domain
MTDAVGERIRKRRKTRGWTLTRLAEAAGTSQGYLSDVENLKVSAPASAILARIAEALDTSTDYLLGLTDNPTPPPSIDESEVIIRNYPDPPEGYEKLTPEQREELDRSTREWQQTMIRLLLDERGQNRR